MAGATIGSLRVNLGLDSASFIKGTKNAQGSMKSMAANMAKIGAGLTASLTTTFVGLGKIAIDGAVAQRQAVAQVESALSSMGNASGKASAELVKMTDALEMKSLFDADVILKQVTANLLTFGNVAGEQFDRAQQAAVDMATRLGGEPQAAAIMLGKALNDPVKGITALTRVGVQFTEQQKAQIGAMQDAGDTAGAQGIILAEVEKQFAGAAEAAANADPYRQMQVALGQLGDVVGEILLPFLTTMTGALTGLLASFVALDPGTQSMIVGIGAVAAVIGPALLVLAGMASGFSALVALGPVVAGAFTLIKVAALGLMANPILLGFAVVLGGIFLAWQNWDKITEIVQRLYTGVKTWLQDKLGVIFSWLRDKIRAVTGFFFDMYDAVVGNSYVPDMVDEIGIEFGKLQGLMVDPAQRAADDVKTAMRNMAGDVSELLARLFPELEDARKQAADLDLLRNAEGAGLISGQTRSSARRRLLGDATVSEFLSQDNPLVDFKEQSQILQDELAKIAGKSKITTVAIAENFGQMADQTLQSLERMTNAIRGGGFLDILSSVVGFGLQLGRIGVFGKSVQAKINAPRSFDGGGFTGMGTRAGGLDGKGGFMAMLHPRESVIDHTKGGMGGGSNIQIVPSPYFDVVVDGRVMRAAPGIAQGGASLAMAQGARMQSRRV